MRLGQSKYTTSMSGQSASSSIGAHLPLTASLTDTLAYQIKLLMSPNNAPSKALIYGGESD